jgi:hypothetical protein
MQIALFILSLKKHMTFINYIVIYSTVYQFKLQNVYVMTYISILIKYI